MANSSSWRCLPPHSPTGKAYPPEFYYDTYNPLWQNRPRVFDFKLQWTQMNPNAVDRIVAYRLGFRQVGTRRSPLHVSRWPLPTGRRLPSKTLLSLFRSRVLRLFCSSASGEQRIVNVVDVADFLQGCERARRGESASLSAKSAFFVFLGVFFSRIASFFSRTSGGEKKNSNPPAETEELV